MAEKDSLDYTDSAVHVEVHVDRRSERGSSKFRLVKFYTAHRTAQGQAQAPSTKKCSKSTSSPSVPTTKCVELPHQYDPNAPIGITPEGYKGYDVNVMGGYDETSTQGILQAVKIDGKRTLSLGGKSLNDDDEDTLFKEYNQVQRNEHGVPITHELGVYDYECCKFPGYYICWHSDNSVDCELMNCSTLDPHHFKWEKKPVPDDDNDNNGKHVQYSWLVARSSNYSLVSPACLTFREPDDKPTIQITNPTKFLVHYPPTN